MKNSYILVTAADRHFFFLAQQLIDSVTDLTKELNIHWGFLDAGLTSEQYQWLELRHIQVQKVLTSTQGDLTAAQLAKPFLPKYFPDYDVIVWLDADTWLQDFRAIEMYILHASQNVLAITPEIHRSYQNMFTPFVESAENTIYQKLLGRKAGLQMGLLPLINTGVFALKSSANTWQKWAESLNRILNFTQGFYSEQAALNYLVYTGQVEVTFLPSYCNFICCQALPVWNPDTCQFMEPGPPWQLIWLLHLAGSTKTQIFQLQTTQGATYSMSLLRPHRLNSHSRSSRKILEK